MASLLSRVTLWTDPNVNSGESLMPFGICQSHFLVSDPHGHLLTHLAGSKQQPPSQTTNSLFYRVTDRKALAWNHLDSSSRLATAFLCDLESPLLPGLSFHVDKMWKLPPKPSPECCSVPMRSKSPALRVPWPVAHYPIIPWPRVP